MKYLLVALAALAALAGPVAAGEFESQVTGFVKAERVGGVEGAVASVRPDPLWGCADERVLERFKEKHPDLPDEITVTGSGYTNGKGKFRFTAKVSWSDGEVPRKSYRGRDGEMVEYDYVPVLLKGKAEGYKTGSAQGVLNDGYLSTINVNLEKMTALKGKVVHADSGEPVPGLKLVLSRRSHYRGRITEDVRHEFTTSEDGAFRFHAEYALGHSLKLRVAGNEYAFKEGTKAWNSLSTSKGRDTDLGTLEVVPGGAVKFRGVDEDSGEPVGLFESRLKLVAGPDGRSFYYDFTSDDKGGVYCEGVPAGRYSLTDEQYAGSPAERVHQRGVHVDAYWTPRLGEFEVKPGEVLDLGDVAFEPYRGLDIFAFGPEGGLMFYQATAVYLGDDPPPNFYDPEATITREARLTAELTTLTGLFTGEWQVAVKADGFPEAKARVSIPAEEPLRVTLTRPARIEYEATSSEEKPYHPRWALAIKHGTRGHEELSKLSAKEIIEEGYPSRRRVLPAGVFRRGRNLGKIEDVHPGTYLVLVADGQGGMLRKDNVQIREGKIVKLHFRPEPGKLIVRLVDGDTPLPGETLVLRRQRDDEDDEVIRLTTDADGKAEYEITRDTQPRNDPDKYFDCVLTGREYEWIENHTNSFPWRLRNIAARNTQLKAGEQTEFTIDLSETAFVFVTFDLGEGVNLGGVSLQRPGEDEDLDPRLRRFNSFRFLKSDDRYGAVCIPPGSYEVSGKVYDSEWDNRHMIAPNQAFKHEIVVKGGEDQTFEIEVDVRRLDIQVKAPDGVSMQDVSVYAVPVTRGYERYDDGRRPDADGRVAFPCIPASDYRVLAHVRDDSGEIVNVAYSVASVPESGGVAVELKLRDDVGAVEVEIESLSGQERGFRGGRAKVRFLDPDGEIVEPGDPLLSQSGAHHFTVPAVPEGTYTVKVAVPGGLPCTVENVRVSRRETVHVKVEPEPAGTLKLNLEGVPYIWDITMTSTYEDENGEPVKLFLPEGNLGWIRQDRKGATKAVLINLTPEVKQVRIKITGRKEFVVKVNVKAGETITRTVKVEKETK